MAKRRFISQLPAINQTQSLQKFFNPTVDQLFQPGETQSINALIGKKPSYYDATKDFYKPEINAERSFYQLEPTMTSKLSTDTTFSDILFYQDLANNLRFHGGNVSNHERLFQTDYYSWCPPVNIKKLVNYREYYWLPDGPPTMILSIPSTSYTGDGHTTVYSLPVALTGLNIDVKVLLNGSNFTDFQVNSTSLIFDTAPTSGSTIQIWVNGDFKNYIEGQETFTFSGAATSIATQVQQQQNIIPVVDAWENKVWDKTETDPWEMNTALTSQQVLVTFGPQDVTNNPALQEDMRLRIIDNRGSNEYTVHFVDGLITLVPILLTGAVPPVINNDLIRTDPYYWTVERNAPSNNMWSRTNHWYHKSVMTYQDPLYAPSQAQRPIIEFFRDMVLYNSGTNEIQGIDYVYDQNNNSSGLTLSQQNGIRQEESAYLPGKRILAYSSSETIYNNKILETELDSELDLWDTAGFDARNYDDYTDVINFAPVYTPVEYDRVGLNNDPAFISSEVISTNDQELWTDISLGDVAQTEYWFDGTAWKRAQEFTKQPPLFQLFDSYGVEVDDSSKYPQSTFAGNKVFAYKLSTLDSSVADTVLGVKTIRNNYGQFEYTDHTATNIDNTGADAQDTISYGITAIPQYIPGYRYYGLVGSASNYQSDFSYQCNWHFAGQTTQTQNTNGLWEIPQNLQANPLNTEVTTISANDWNAQFTQLLQGSDWTRDSRSVLLNTGKNIVQNTESLLKNMLMNSNNSTDFMRASAYVEREYLRYRNKFAQFITKLDQSEDITDVNEAILRALAQLKTAKTPDFPFYNSGMAAIPGISTDWYMPASGAFLGLTALWEPEYLIAYTKSSSVLQVKGHDGSVVNGVTIYDTLDVTIGPLGVPVDASNTALDIDIKDQILLAFEKIIYDSADTEFKIRRRPAFDLLSVTTGKFREGQYSRDELLTITRPIFERWASQFNKEYRTNSSYDTNNPFTWNYSSNFDIEGESVPGYWRGMYKWYFDTDRPHTHAWEMLGYTFKPAWWDAHYSWIDAPKRAALISAIEQGLVSDPDDVEPTIDSTFARPSLGGRIPVDTMGKLLDPIQAGIILDNGVYDYSNDWVWGDGSPVESQWLTSQLTSFVQSELSYLMKPVRFTEFNWASTDMAFVNDSQWVMESTLKRMIPSTVQVHNEVVDSTYIRKLGLQTWIADYIKSLGQNVTTVLGDPLRAIGVNLAHKLGGFCDPATIRTFTENFGLIPEENVSTALYRSPSVSEEFYGGVIVEWTGNGWKIYGYDTVDPVFNILPAIETGTKSKISLAGTTESSPYNWHADTYYSVNVLVQYKNTNYRCTKTHTSGRLFEQEYWAAESTAKFSPSGSVLWYKMNAGEDEVERVQYGTMLYSRQDVATFLSGYSAYLESRGWVFDEYDATTNLINNWEKSTREFLVWTQSSWAPGTFIALSPAATAVKFTSTYGTIQNVEQLVNGAYSVLSREGAAIPKNNVTVNRSDDQIVVGVTAGGIYGLRVFKSEIEHVIVFDNTTIFNDVIYDPLYDIRQNRIRLITLSSTDWVGRLDAPGFIVTDNMLVPSFDRQVEDIRFTYGIEEPIKLPLRDNARHQIGYQSRTYLENIMFNEVNQFEFYQGMIKQKGTPSIYDKLLRSQELTTTRDLAFLEEWAIRTGTFGGIDAKSTFEFELHSDQVKEEPQLVVFQNVGFWDIKNWDEFAWDDAVTREELTAMDSQDDSVITLYTAGDTHDSRWVIPMQKNTSVFFPDELTYVRKKGYLPSAGYARIDESTWQALNFAELQTQVTNYLEDVVIGDQMWIYTNEAMTWGMYNVDNVSSDNFANDFTNTVDGMVVTFDNTPTIQVGDYVYLTKEVLNDIGTTGFYQASAVDTVNKTVSIAAESVADRTYETDETRPTVLRLYNTRSSLSVINNQSDVTTKKNAITANTISVSALNALTNNTLRMPSSGTFLAGALVYVDYAYEFTVQDATPFLASTDKRWAVFQYVESTSQFELYRTQPETIRRDLIRDVRIFDTTTRRDDTTLNAKPLILSDILVYAPIQGIIPGVAEKEIWYKVEYDPANYNVSSVPSYGFEWGAEQVGRLWWDLSTTRYLLAETDMATDVEMTYRKANWGKLAPSSTIDIYEWVESSVDPTTWNANFVAATDTTIYDGTTYATDEYVQTTKWDASLGSDVTVYYFWVKNRVNVPTNDSTRETSAASVSAILTNPANAGLSWISPLSESSLIVAGVSQYLTTSSTLNVEIAEVEIESPKHVEWSIIRKGDERSQPDRSLWTKLCMSLTGRNEYGNVLPDPNRYITDQIGFDVENGQNMFGDVKAARKHLVTTINTILARTLLVDTRRDASVLNTSEGSEYLIWNQKLNSYYREPYPVGSASISNNNGLWNTRFSSETDMVTYDQAGRGRFPTYGLLTRFEDENTFWSVMEMDRWDDTPSTQAESDFDNESWDAPNIRKMWSYEVDTLAERDALLGTVNAYDLIRVNGDSTTDNYWSLWRLNEAETGFTMVQMQRYNSADCWTHIDWYDANIDVTAPPVVTYPSIASRNAAFEIDQTYTFVKVLDDGSGRWMWNQYVDGIWEVVAKQNGTVALSDSIWSTTGTDNFVNVPSSVTEVVTAIPSDILTQIANRDRGFELNFILNSLRDNILTSLEVNEILFSLIEYVHTEQNFIDWCFKTSFMYVTGFNETLAQRPIQNTDYTSNLLDYINEVKPYHVKIRDFISKYGTPIDIANVSVMDYDKPMYFDKATNTYRLLNPNDANDQVILQTGIYKNWYSQYLAGNKLVRKLNLTSKYFDEVQVSVSGSVRIRVDQRAGEGAPITGNVVVHDGVTTDTVVTVLPIIVPEQQSIAVFDAGVRVNPEAITFDPFVSTVTYTKPAATDTIVEVAGFGYGSDGLLRDTLYFAKTAGTNTFDLGYTDLVRSQLFISLDGVVLNETDANDATNVSLTGSILTLDASLPNGLVQVAILDTTSGEIAEVETYTFQAADIVGQSFATLYPDVANSARWPLSENFIFEVDGIRKNIELAYNINVTELNRVLRLDVDTDISNLKAQFAGQPAVIGTDLRRELTFPKVQRCVEIGVDTSLDQISVTDSNGNPMIVGEVISSYPFTNIEIDPYNVPLNYTRTLAWENNNMVVWEDDTQQWEYMGDQPAIRVIPENADLILYQGYLMKFDPIPQDIDIVVRFKNFIPTNFTHWTWTPTNAPIVKIDDALVVTTKAYGLLKVVDSTPATRDMSISDTIDPNASFVTITDLKRTDLMGTRNHTNISYGQMDFPISALPFNDSAIWINLNGKRLILGIDYQIVDTLDRGFDIYSYDADELESQRYRYRGLISEDVNLGFGTQPFDTVAWDQDVSDYDISLWDTQVWDVYGTPLVTKAVRILNGTEVGDVLTITVFPGVQASVQKEFELFIVNSESGGHGVYHDIPLSSKYTLISGDMVTEDTTSSARIKQEISPRMFAPTNAAFNDFVWIEGEGVRPGSVVIDAAPHDNEVDMNSIVRGTNVTSIVPHASGSRVVLAYTDAPI